MHTLLNRVSPQPFFAQLPPNSALLHPSKRYPTIAIIAAIDPNHPRLKPPRHTMSPRNVARENRRSQAIDRIVGEGYRFGFGVEGRDAHQRAKDFFAEDAHVRVDVAENSWGDEEAAFAFACCCWGFFGFDELGAFGFAYADVFLHAAVLGAGDLGALEG